ncbi:MAG: PAS domain S-box protein [Parachlamydia sp.]|nr:PAS domain S-box protein [Parachlamydia sp.]
MDAETGERGYVITGNSLYLEPFDKALQYFNSPRLKKFKVHEKLNEESQIAVLNKMAEKKLEQLSEINKLRKEEGFDEAAKVIASGKGKDLMDEIRSVVDAEIASKQEGLRELDESIQDKMHKTTLLLLATNLISSLLALCLYSIYRSMRKIQAKDRELSHAYQQLDESSAMNQAILTSTNDAIISVDSNGIITTFNPAAEHLLGYSKEEMVGKLTPRSFHLDDEIESRAVQLSKQLSRWIQPGFNVFTTLPDAGTHDTNEWTYVRKDGTRVPILLSVTAIRDQTGKLTGYVGFVKDITERKEIERMKNDLIAMTSYQLQSPVVAIKGSLDLLSQQEFNLSEKANKVLELGKKYCKRLLKLTDDILNIQKIESGKMDIHLQPINAAAFLSQIILSYMQIAQQSGVKLTLSAVEPAMNFEGDEERLGQVIDNLVENALQHSPKDSQVGLKAYEKNNRVHFEISDQRSGIPEELRDSLFQKFPGILKEKSGDRDFDLYCHLEHWTRICDK